MKIAIVMPSIGGGGAERVSVTLAGYLARRNYEVSIVYFLDGKDYKVPANVEVYRLKYRKLPVIRHIGRAMDFMRFCRRKKIELVLALYTGYDFTFLQHICSRGCLIKHSSPGTKLILSERNDPECIYREDVKARLQMKLYYHDADAVVFQTEMQKLYFNQDIQKKGCLIPNPVKSGLPDIYRGKRDRRIVNFCRLTPQKNLKLLIDAFGQVSDDDPDCRLIIYGDGEMKQELLNYIRERGLDEKAKVLPFSKNIHLDIREAAMFVSSSDYEGISNSMLEAMAMGLPCICTDCPCGGARLMIHNNSNGILVPTGDREALSAAMKQVLGDSGFAARIGEEAAKVREAYSASKICRQWEELIERVVHENA